MLFVEVFPLFCLVVVDEDGVRDQIVMCVLKLAPVFVLFLDFGKLEVRDFGFFDL